MINSHPMVGRLPFLVLFFLTPSLISSFSGNQHIQRIHQEISEPVHNQVLQYLCENSQPGDRIAIWGWEPSIYPYTGLLMGTRESQSQRQIFSVEQQDYYLDRYIRDLKQNQPRYFVDTTEKNDVFFRHDKHNFTRYPVIREYIQSCYRFAIADGGMELYVKTPCKHAL